jgi:hypothetical protein
METQKTSCVLKTVGNAVKENTNGTKFRTCTVDINGTVYFAKVWEKSVQNGLTVGATYQAELQADGDKIWITMLNGTDAKIATAADFAHLFSNITV